MSQGSSMERLLLLVEDDEAFARVLKRSFERRDYKVLHASSQEEMQDVLLKQTPTHAVVDLKLSGNSSGLNCVQALHEHNPTMLIVVLTGFASINTAVEAIKLGACQYLAKPSNTDDIEAAFGHVAGSEPVELTNRKTSIKNLEWEPFTRCWWKQISIFQKQRAGWVCIAARWPASSRSAA